MTGKLFKTSEILFTPLTEEEIFSQLEKHTVSDKALFKGQLNREQHEFRLLQLFDYDMRNQLRPEIIGLAESKDGETTIHLKMELPKTIEMLFDFSVVFNIVVIIVILFIPFPAAVPKLFFLIGIPVALLLSYIIGVFTFNTKSRDCIILLQRMLDAKSTSSS